MLRKENQHRTRQNMTKFILFFIIFSFVRGSRHIPNLTGYTEIGFPMDERGVPDLTIKEEMFRKMTKKMVRDYVLQFLALIESGKIGDEPVNEFAFQPPSRTITY